MYYPSTLENILCLHQGVSGFLIQHWMSLFVGFPICIFSSLEHCIEKLFFAQQFREYQSGIGRDICKGARRRGTPQSELWLVGWDMRVTLSGTQNMSIFCWMFYTVFTASFNYQAPPIQKLLHAFPCMIWILYFEICIMRKGKFWLSKFLLAMKYKYICHRDVHCAVLHRAEHQTEQMCKLHFWEQIMFCFAGDCDASGVELPVRK